MAIAKWSKALRGARSVGVRSVASRRVWRFPWLAGAAFWRFRVRVVSCALTRVHSYARGVNDRFSEPQRVRLVLRFSCPTARVPRALATSRWRLPKDPSSGSLLSRARGAGRPADRDRDQHAGRRPVQVDICVARAVRDPGMGVSVRTRGHGGIRLVGIDVDVVPVAVTRRRRWPSRCTRRLMVAGWCAWASGSG